MAHDADVPFGRSLCCQSRRAVGCLGCGGRFIYFLSLSIALSRYPSVSFTSPPAGLRLSYPGAHFALFGVQTAQLPFVHSTTFDFSSAQKSGGEGRVDRQRACIDREHKSFRYRETGSDGCGSPHIYTTLNGSQEARLCAKVRRSLPVSCQPKRCTGGSCPPHRLGPWASCIPEERRAQHGESSSNRLAVRRFGQRFLAYSWHLFGGEADVETI
ncbi:hypothetical protein LZ30DRAFT_718003 [Colletotrichum cereale]|nr:hypothetical protein LZ30DRAFT_718003 [Colletotrichum cereale]